MLKTQIKEYIRIAFPYLAAMMAAIVNKQKLG